MSTLAAVSTRHGTAGLLGIRRSARSTTSGGSTVSNGVLDATSFRGSSSGICLGDEVGDLGGVRFQDAGYGGEGARGDLDAKVVGDGAGEGGGVGRQGAVGGEGVGEALYACKYKSVRGRGLDWAWNWGRDGLDTYRNRGEGAGVDVCEIADVIVLLGRGEGGEA